MRLLVFGSRLWTAEKVIGEALRRANNRFGIEVLIHGGARGADFMAGRQAERLGIPIEVFPANWDRDGKAAGPIRNQQMLVEGRPDWAWGFATDLESSRGSADMSRRSVRWDGVSHVFLHNGVAWSILKQPQQSA